MSSNDSEHSEYRDEPENGELSNVELSNLTSDITALPAWQDMQTSEQSRKLLPFSINPFQHRHHANDSSETCCEKTSKRERARYLLGTVKDVNVKQASKEKVVAAKNEVKRPFVSESRRALYFRQSAWLIAAFTTVLSVALILGAVLGTFIKQGLPPEPETTKPVDHEGDVGTSTGLPLPSPTGMPKRHAGLNSLAATGWNVPGSNGEYNVWVFYQTREGYLNMATYDSKTKDWTRASNFTMAKAGTPITATVADLSVYKDQEVYSFLQGNYQVSVAYIDDRNTIKDWVFTDVGPKAGQAGLLKDRNVVVHPDTQLGYYWPELSYQTESGDVRMMSFDCISENLCWYHKDVERLHAKNATQVVMAPVGNERSSTAMFYNEQGAGLMYRRESSSSDGRVQTRHSKVLPDEIPSNASVAAFSIAQPSNPSSEYLTTFLLWQDKNNTIQITNVTASAANDEKWETPISPGAFKGANNETALACVTGPTSRGHPLEQGTQVNRCFFQSGQFLREVNLQGGKWRSVGDISIED